MAKVKEYEQKKKIQIVFSGKFYDAILIKKTEKLKKKIMTLKVCFL